MRFNAQMLFWSCTLSGCVLFWVAVVGCVSTAMRDVPNVMAQLERDAIKPEEMTPLLGVKMLPEVQFTTARFASVHVGDGERIPGNDGQRDAGVANRRQRQGACNRQC